MRAAVLIVFHKRSCRSLAPQTISGFDEPLKKRIAPIISARNTKRETNCSDAVNGAQQIHEVEDDERIEDRKQMPIDKSAENNEVG